MTYEYEDQVTGETLTVEQRISDEPFRWYDPKEDRFVHGMKALSRWHPVKRLISGAPEFNLIPGASGGWANEGYSTPENFRRAEKRLGHKVHRKL